MIEKISTKEYQYLSFDISTKSKFYKSNHHSILKKYLTKTLNFEWIKDTNYISLNKISNNEKITIEKKIAKRYPAIVKSMTKFNWSVWLPIANSDALSRLQSFVLSD